MGKKKQQTIEGTLGRPVLKAKPPKPRAAKTSSSSTPKKDGTLSGEGSQLWFYAPKDEGTPKPKAPRPPPSSFMPPSSTRKRATILDSSSSSADEASSLDDDEEGTPKRKPSPVKRVNSAKGGKRQTQLKLGSSPRSAVVVKDESSEEEEEDEDDLPVATPRVSRLARQKGKKPVAVSDESEEDSDDKPIVTPNSRKRPAPKDDSDEDDEGGSGGLDNRRQPAKRAKRARSEDDEDEEDDEIIVQSTKRRRLARKNGVTVSSSPPQRSSPTKRQHRSEKDKRRELLRRRRAGEDITMDDLQTSEEEETHAALYDTDSDHVALDEFEDDDEGVLQPQEVAMTKPKKEKKKEKKKSEKEVSGASNDEDEALDDFIDSDDEDEKLGVPAELLDMPLEFTRHSRKPLKEHFRDVVEWLVRFKFEPNFDEKHNELYLLGWKKLDDEVAALASSKFASSAWKPEFRRALNARPKFISVELPRGDLDRLFSTCEACGRSGHPATWTVMFQGNAYHRKNNKDARFLEDVESDEEEEDSSSSSSSSSVASSPSPPKPQRDEDGNELPPESRQWSVGAVCKSNAETAHTLIHWKHHLLEWVGDRLENDGFMSAQQIASRARMKRKARNKVVDDIIAGWFDERAIEDLYREFKNVLDDARNKSTTGRGGGRWGR